MKKTLKIVITIVIVIVLICAAVVGGVFIWLNSVKKADSYEIGGESISSIKTVVGERKVVSVSSKIEDGVKTKTYNFVSDTASEDTYAYTKYLVEKEGFMNLKDTGQNGIYTYAKESKESGKILLVNIIYTSSNFSIQLQKGDGSLTY